MLSGDRRKSASPSMSYCSNRRTKDTDDPCSPSTFFLKNSSIIKLKTQKGSGRFSRTSMKMLESVSATILGVLL